MQNLSDVMKLWETNQEFREKLLKTPTKEYLASKNIQLSENDLNKVIAMVKLHSKKQSGLNIDLEKKINK